MKAAPKGIFMNWKTDEEVKDIINQALKSPVKRETITRWRSGSRSPKFTDTQEIEAVLGIPFEAFIRNADLQEIENKLHVQLKNIKALIKEEKEREELQKAIK